MMNSTRLVILLRLPFGKILPRNLFNSSKKSAKATNAFFEKVTKMKF